MLVSLVRGDPAFSSLRPVPEADWQVRGGDPAPDAWEDVDFTPLEGGASDFIAVDCLTTNTATDGFLVSEIAREVLAPVIGIAGQFLPVRVLGRRYWWLNCLACVEALDRAGTDADWSVVEGGWGSFSWISSTRRLEFLPRRLRTAPSLFRIPEYPQGVLFARDALAEAVREGGLVGFTFDPVWSSAEGGVPDPAGFGFRAMFQAGEDAAAEGRRQRARDALAKRQR